MSDHQQLADLVEDDHGDRDEREEAEAAFGDARRRDRTCGAGPGWVRAGQRRSSFCLHETHRVARGNACRRALPIGLPQDSHTP